MINAFAGIHCKLDSNVTWAGRSGIGCGDGAFSNDVDGQSECRRGKVAAGLGDDTHAHLLREVLVQCRPKHRHYLHTHTHTFHDPLLRLPG